MAVWELIDDSNLKKLYLTIPAQVFLRKRWFADREYQGEINLINSAQFRKRGTQDLIIALNLFETRPGAGYFYYIPLLVSGSPLNYQETLFQKGNLYFYDCVATPEYISLLEELFLNQASIPVPQGFFQFQPYRDFIAPDLRLHGSTSNSLLFVSRRYLLKNYRRIYPGINPELKINTALAKIGSKQVPEIYGYFQFHSQAEQTLGIILEVVDNFGTGWEVWGQLLKNVTFDVENIICQEAESLGSILAMLHRDLAIIARQDEAYFNLQNSGIEERINKLIGNIQENLTGFRTTEAIIQKLDNIKEKLAGRNLGGVFRIHGDLHLEQVIKTENGWKVLDFEGEPLKSINERENYDSPLKDLATMLRSISYRLSSIDFVEGTEEMEAKAAAGLIEGYLNQCRKDDVRFIPEQEQFTNLLLLFQIERAVYECIYESKYRPDWLWIPQTGLEKLVCCD